MKLTNRGNNVLAALAFIMLIGFLSFNPWP